MSNSDDLARAASDMVDAWRAEHPASEWPADWLVDARDLGYRPTIEHVAVTYTTVRDQARAIIDGDDVLQQCVADLVTAGAGEDEARVAVATVVEYALKKGILRVQ